MSFACCERCGSAGESIAVLDYGSRAGKCPDCGGPMRWMATPFAQRVLERRRRQDDPYAMPLAPGEADAWRLSSAASNSL
jgi:hypothetical protein